MKIEYDYSKLKGKIVEKCKTQTNYAKMIGNSPSMLCKKLSNKCPFTQNDISYSIKSDILDISQEEIGMYFFTRKLNLIQQNFNRR